MGNISKKVIAMAATASIVAAPLAGQITAYAKDGDLQVKGTYSITEIGTDYGVGVNKATIALDHAVDGASVSKDDFVVKEHKNATNWMSPTFDIEIQDFDRTVTAAYISDENGNRKTAGSSKYITLELLIDPNTGSDINYNLQMGGYNEFCSTYELHITKGEGRELTVDGKVIDTLTIKPEYTDKTSDADNWGVSTYKATDGVEYGYAAYQVEGSKNLFVWLHGMGEGAASSGINTDPTMTILGNKVAALSGDKFQSKFEGGCSILSPQSPTFWLDGTGEGKFGNFNGNSFYTESLHELIVTYAEAIGAENVMIGGCSNGGFMTMVMAREYGDEFDAYVPICEALGDNLITDAQIRDMAKLPMFFIWSQDDTSVDPSKCEIPTVARLRKAGAANLHVFNPAHVIDTTGEYTNPDGSKPYEYMGHWSWIYFDNNEAICDDEGIDVFSWLAAQCK